MISSFTDSGQLASPFLRDHPSGPTTASSKSPSIVSSARSRPAKYCIRTRFTERSAFAKTSSPAVVTRAIEVRRSSAPRSRSTRPRLISRSTSRVTSADRLIMRASISRRLRPVPFAPRSIRSTLYWKCVIPNPAQAVSRAAVSWSATTSTPTSARISSSGKARCWTRRWRGSESAIGLTFVPLKAKTKVDNAVG